MDWLREGYEQTATECPACEEGVLYVNTFELVCDNCGTVLRKGERNGDGDHFRNGRDRERYDNSGKVICPGGFEHVYYGDGIYGEG